MTGRLTPDARRSSIRCIARTTLDINTAVLEALRERPARSDFWWPGIPMGALIDPEDKDALWAILDREQMALGE